MSDTGKVMALIKEHEVKYVDFRFTDPRGKWQHLAHHVRTISENFLNDGVMFDGSSIAGWKAINEFGHDAGAGLRDRGHRPVCGADLADRLLRRARAHDRPALCPRPALDREKGRAPPGASTGIGDTAYFGPEAEFFIFDDVRYQTGMNGAMYAIDSAEGPWVSGKEFADGNTGHRPPIKGGYFPVPPVDSQSDLRAEMLSVMADMGLKVEKHHHEVAPVAGRIGVRVLDPGFDRRPHADLQIRRPQRRPAIRQDRDLYAQAGHGRQRLGHAHPPVVVEEREHLVRRQSLRRLVRDGALLHRRDHPPRQGDQRLHQPDDQQLQAADPRLRGAGTVGLFVAQPLGLVPHPLCRRAPKPNASRCATPTPPPTPISPLPRC